MTSTTLIDIRSAISNAAEANGIHINEARGGDRGILPYPGSTEEFETDSPYGSRALRCKYTAHVGPEIVLEDVMDDQGLLLGIDDLPLPAEVELYGMVDGSLIFDATVYTDWDHTDSPEYNRNVAEPLYAYHSPTDATALIWGDVAESGKGYTVTDDTEYAVELHAPGGSYVGGYSASNEDEALQIAYGLMNAYESYTDPACDDLSHLDYSETAWTPLQASEIPDRFPDSISEGEVLSWKNETGDELYIDYDPASTDDGPWSFGGDGSRIHFGDSLAEIKAKAIYEIVTNPNQGAMVLG